MADAVKGPEENGRHSADCGHAAARALSWSNDGARRGVIIVLGIGFTKASAKHVSNMIQGLLPHLE
jgi:hypothetical protein